ncbi:zinc dependent phospholipase C family protein [Anaerobium acetethylicum]|uniref:Zinc dependent phospholipase C n=1 Tax=Anaerobium acetethylicum TaxID=1619234 RepID=A0A1D3TP45_9FIRM|nr:zinc dependent phospholipase C family protein [Anaerobium acetethylicum]SCP95149.1 Zinc dependent phospholipase C [Anaerobium acetethylicum]
MPTTYAHYSFGKKVLENLNPEIKELITGHLPLFYLGLHGPDILFYYNPLHANPIIQAGDRLHKKNADEFFKMARSIIQKCPDPDAATSYILGFICHFMLDSECHPYIEEKVVSTGISHAEIEMEFDRALIVEDGLNPLAFRPTGHLNPDIANAECISWFFKAISKKQILSALKSMKAYLNLLVAPGILKRNFIIAALRITGNYDHMIGLMVKHEPNPACADTCNTLKILSSATVCPTVKMLHEYHSNLNNSEKLSSRFSRNYL